MKFERNNKYTTVAIYACIVILFAVICFAVVLNFAGVKRFFVFVGNVLAPLAYGGIIAYILNPVMAFFERRVFIPRSIRKIRKDAKNKAIAEGVTNKFKLEKIMDDAAAEEDERQLSIRNSKSKKKKKQSERGRSKRKRKVPLPRRAASLTVTYLIFLTVIILLFSIIIPQIAGSLSNIYNQIYTFITGFPSMIDDMIEKYDWFKSFYGIISEHTELGHTDITTFLTNRLLSESANIISWAQSAATEIFTQVKNIFLGAILSIYFLLSKDMLKRQAIKLLDALAPVKISKFTRHVFTQFDRKFGQFIQGKLLDSLIIGILTFIVLWIFRIPYFQLISVVVGITNIIPFFGPFIGAIPSAIIIFINDPEHFSNVILFVVIIIIIQQIDGNLIGPRILGSTIDLSSVWIMIAILLMSGLFGVFGMFFGVPIFAVIYTLISEAINRRLAIKLAGELTSKTDTTDFVTVIKEKEAALHDDTSGAQ